VHKKHTILLVEDDPTLGYLLREYLGMNDFDITVSETVHKALEVLQTNTFDLAILDVMLPDGTGFELAQKLTQRYPNLAFLFLTARSLKVDVLKGFSLGAVDYLKKPIDEEELVVRIKSLLSRLQPIEEALPVAKIQKIGKYQFEANNQQLKFEKQTTTLTKRETELLQFLLHRKNNLSTHTEILDSVWGNHDYFNQKSLNVFISRLRKYLEKDPKVQIENVHKQGFILRVH